MRTTLTGSSLAVVALVGSSIVVAGGCTEPKGSEPASSATASASAPTPSARAPEATAPRREQGPDVIRPVIPLDAPPDPLAKRYCEAIYILPEKRKAECCSATVSPALEGVEDLCVKTLSYELVSKSVALAPADVEACVLAINKETQGCDWVKPFSLEPPPACEGIIKGALAKDAPCRSSLECGEGMRCQGLSTVDVGKCDAPKPARYPCNLAMDVLASHTRQASFERAHPECAGFCNRSRCADAVADGGECSMDLQCGRGRCEHGKCTSAPLPALGEACAGSCAPGARCAKGKCVAPKGEGEACEVNEECRAMCVRGAGVEHGAGKCEKLCVTPPFSLSPKKPPKR